MSTLAEADRLTWVLHYFSVCGIGQMQMNFTDMLSLDCTNQGRMAKDGNIHLSKVRSWQANVIEFDDKALNEWLNNPRYRLLLPLSCAR